MRSQDDRGCAPRPSWRVHNRKNAHRRAERGSRWALDRDSERTRLTHADPPLPSRQQGQPGPLAYLSELSMSHMPYMDVREVAVAPNSLGIVPDTPVR